MEGEKNYSGSPEQRGEILVTELAKVLKDKLDADTALRNDRFEWASDFIDELKSKGYSETEIRGTKLFHVLVGSSEFPDTASSPADLPNGEFEIFIRSL